MSQGSLHLFTFHHPTAHLLLLAVQVTRDGVCPHLPALTVDRTLIRKDFFF